MIQIDGPRRRVFIKFANTKQSYVVILTISGKIEYGHDNGELCTVNIELAGMDIRRNRIANQPPEVPHRTIRDTLSIVW